MQAKIPASLSRILTCVMPVLFLAGCFGEGDGPTRIPGTPAPTPPPEGFCDVINFEVACEPFEFTNFAGGDASIIDNPDKSGLNTTDRVARMLKFDPGNGEAFGGTLLALSEALDFSEGEAFTMKVWASRPVPVLFKLEPDGDRRLELERSHSGSGEWEELCFDFTGDTTNTPRTGLTLIFDNGVIGQAATDPANWTFFFDEIAQVANCDGVVEPAPVNLPVTFEAAPESYDFGQENGFAGGVATVIANPDRTGLNTTAQTARMQKFAGEVFGGATLVLDDLIDFGEGEAFRMKVWSARSVPVLFKLEDAVSGLPELGKEGTATHSGSGSWEEFCFDFSGDLAGFSSNSITFIFDLGVLGDAENNPDDWTFYFDEITQVASCGDGGADPGIIPDAVVFASDPNVTVDLPPPLVDDLGSGATFDFFFAGDADFSPALRVISAGDIGGGPEGNITVNGGFETGTFDGWQRFENNGVLTIVTDNPSSGTYAANLVVPVRAAGDSPADPLIKNANLEAGNLTPGATVTVSFDMRGTLSGAGGVVFAELFSELAGEGVSKAEILSGGPLAPTAEWSTYSFTTTLGPDVGGGVTLQLKASCGAVEGCGVDVVVDNASIVLGTGTASVANSIGNSSITDAVIASNHANVGQIALTGYAPGFAAGFETFNFKVKGLPTGTIEVRFIEGGDTSRVYDVNTYAGSTDLGNGWYQLSIPMTDFAATIASNQGFVLGPLGAQAAPFSFLLTDIGFSGTAGGGGTDPVSLSVNFEAAPESYDFGQEAGFAGGVATVIANPDRSGINTTAQTARMQKFAGEVFGGATLVLDDLIDFSEGEAFNMKVWASRSVPVLFKLEDAVSGLPELGREATATHSGSGSWEEFCFDFSGDLAGFSSNSITFIFDLGIVGDAENNPDDWTFYFDEITQVAGCDGGGGEVGVGIIPDVVLFATDPSVPIDLVFGVDYTGLEPFGSGSVFDNNNTSDADFNPAFSVTTGTGYGANIGQLAFVGFDAGFAAGFGTLDFKVKGMSNDLIRLRFLDNGAYLDVDLTAGGVSTLLGNGWYQVSVPLASMTGVDTATALLFETDNASPTEFTFLLTDIGFSGTADDGGGGGGGGGDPGTPVGNIAVNGDFETGTLEGWESLPGGGTVTVSTDNPATGTYSVNLIVPVRGEGDPPVDNLLKNANLEAGNLTPGDTITVSFDMRGSLSGAGGVVFAELFSELSGGGTSKSEILGGGPLTPNANWTNYSFTTTLGSDVSGGVTLQLKASCGPVVGCGVNVFIDNVTITVGSGGTGGSGFAAITFDDPDTTYTLTGFNGAEGSFVTNDPAGGVNMVAQVDRSAAAQADAGTVVSTGENSTIQTLPLDAQNTQMTVLVYSPAAGVPVRLKIEDSSDANVAVETEAATTAVGTWETLTFNFLNEVAGTTPFDPAATYDRLTIFFNFGTDGATAGAQTFYLDDIDVLAGTGGGGEGVELVVNGGFETGDLTDWNASGTGGVIGIESPGASGSFAVNVDASGGPFIGILRQANLGAGQLTPGQEVTVSFDWKGIAGIGGIARIAVISEPGGAGTAQVESIIDTGAFPADWTTVGPTTFNLGPEVGGGVTFQVFVECGAESSCVADVSLDNISIIAALSGGGEPDAVLVTFDEAPAPAVTAFGGAVATIEPGPAGGDGTNALNIFRDGGQNFAGAYVFVPVISSEPESQTVSADVYSPTAGVPMPARLVSTDGAVGTGDVQANEAVVAGWQTLTWTFTSLDPAEEYSRFAMLPNSGAIDTATSYFFDNITLVGAGGGGGGGDIPVGDAPGSCGGAGELSTNCDFETGDLTGWDVFTNGGLVEVVATGGSSSLFAAHLVAGPTQNPLIKQFELAAGVVTPGASVTISFDMKGSLQGDGGVVFAEFFSEGDPTTGQILTGGPIFPTIEWTTYTFTPTAGADVTRGITFQLAAVCGAVSGCGVDIYIDNVSVIIN